MSGNETEQVQAMRDICAAIFGRNNLTNTDFVEAQAWRLNRQFPQDDSGVMLQFCISNQALEKISSKAVTEALCKLLPN